VVRITLAVPSAAKPLGLTDTLGLITAAVASDRLSLTVLHFLLPVNGAVQLLHLVAALRRHSRLLRSTVLLMDIFIKRSEMHILLLKTFYYT